jgi:hypothetical protein
VSRAARWRRLPLRLFERRLAFVLAGVGIGFAETAQTTMVALALPDHLRGNGFGVLGLLQSLGDLGAALVMAWLWAASGQATGWSAAPVAAMRPWQPRALN